MLAQGVYENLVKRLSEQENLVSPSFELLNEDATLDLLCGLSRIGHIEYLGLSFPLVLHVLGIVSVMPNTYCRHFTYLIESNVLPLIGFETDEVNKPLPVLGILRSAKLENHSVVLCDQSPLLGVFRCQLVEQDQEVP